MSATPDSAAFDALAASYDTDFTGSAVGRLLRPRVWRHLRTHFEPGQHILDMACGTGEDACWLAHRGINVTAVDGSAAMVSEAQRKAAALSNVEVRQMAWSQLDALDTVFDGAFSNFGGLNTLSHCDHVAATLSQRIKPGGYVILVVMGPVCPWEIGWHLLHGDTKTAFRRLKSGAIARIGDTTIPVWYPGARRLTRDFAPGFRPCYTESLGFLLPPSYLDHLVGRWPMVSTRLNRFEQCIARWLGDWGDHYVQVFQKL